MVLNRQTFPDAVTDRLFFAQVREDPTVEIEAFNPTPGKTYAVVGSGGCTALSLVSSGAGKVIAIDLNATQNHLIELKVAALSEFEHETALKFIGAWETSKRDRKKLYGKLRPHLSLAARQYWDDNTRMIGKGVLRSGVTERFIGVIMRVVRTVIHSPKTVKELLDCATLEEQQKFYDERWNTKRWRLLFKVLLNRFVFRKTYEPAFFEYVENPSFANHFYSLAEHCLTKVPIDTNYFVRQMLTGYYGHKDSELPLYLQQSKSDYIDGINESVLLVDGTYVDYLRSMPDGSIDGYFLSNICEWLPTQQLDELFTEIVRTSSSDAILVFRNFVGWNEVPENWSENIIEDKDLGEQLIHGDRSALQRRAAVCAIKSDAESK